eukprot:6359212-Prymnesium_polylepis.1
MSTLVPSHQDATLQKVLGEYRSVLIFDHFSRTETSSDSFPPTLFPSTRIRRCIVPNGMLLQHVTPWQDEDASLLILWNGKTSLCAPSARA